MTDLAPSFGSHLAAVLYGPQAELESALRAWTSQAPGSDPYPLLLPQGGPTLANFKERDRAEGAAPAAPSVRCVLATVLEVAEDDIRVRHFDPDRGERIERSLDRTAVGARGMALAPGERVTLWRTETTLGAPQESLQQGWAPVPMDEVEERLRALGPLTEDDDPEDGAAG